MKNRDTQCRVREPWEQSEEWKEVTAGGRENIGKGGWGAEVLLQTRRWYSYGCLLTREARVFPVQLLQLTAGVGNPWPRSQIWPTACICTAFELRMDFMFLNGWEQNSKEAYFMACENMKFEFQPPYSVIGIQSCSFIFALSLAHFLSWAEKLQQKPTGLQSLDISYVALIEVHWPVVIELLHLFCSSVRENKSESTICLKFISEEIICFI